MSKSQSQTKKFPIQNFAIFIIAFLVIGMMFGQIAGQVYTGISVTGSDTVELTNDGNLDTKVRDFSIISGDALNVQPITIINSGAELDGVFDVTMSYVDDMDSDYDNVYFVDSSGNLLNFGLRSGYTSESAVFGVSMTLPAGTTEIFVKYDGVVTGASDSSALVHVNEDFSSGYGAFDSRVGHAFTTNEVTGGVVSIHRNADWGNIGASISTQQTFAKTDGLKIEFDYDRSAVTTGYGDYTEGVKVHLTSYADTVSRVALSSDQIGATAHDPTSAKSLMWKSIDTVSNDWRTVTIYLDGAGNYKVDAGSWAAIPDYETLSSTFDIDFKAAGHGGYGNNDYIYFDNIIVSPYARNVPTVTVGDRLVNSVVDPGLEVGADKVYYDGTLVSTLIASDGSYYIDSTDVSVDVKGDFPIIKVGTTQNIKIDHGLAYSITYIPKTMDVSSPNMFVAGQDLAVNTRLIDTSGNPISYQPLEMRTRLFNSDGDLCLDEIISSTNFVIPGKYIKSGQHYQLRMSYEGYEFGGWSNEILADFDVGIEGFIITSSPDKAPEGIAAASFAAASNLVGMAAAGWLNIPIIGDIIKFIADLLGVTL